MKRIIRFKTLDELLDTGWEYDSSSVLFLHGEDNIIKAMHKFFGKIIVVSYDKNIQSALDHTCSVGYHEGYSISPGMISEELNVEDYPEYFI